MLFYKSSFNISYPVWLLCFFYRNKSVHLLFVGARPKSCFQRAKSSPISEHYTTIQNIKTRTPQMELKLLQLNMNLQLPPCMITLAEITLIMRYWIRNPSIQIQTTCTAIWCRYSWSYSWEEINNKPLLLMHDESKCVCYIFLIMFVLMLMTIISLYNCHLIIRMYKASLYIICFQNDLIKTSMYYIISLQHWLIWAQAA